MQPVMEMNLMPAMQHAGANPCQNVGMHHVMLLHTHHVVSKQH